MAKYGESMAAYIWRGELGIPNPETTKVVTPWRMKYVVCAECIKPYRSTITTHNDDTDIYRRASV